MNHTNITEIPLGEVVTAGKFLIDQHPTVVLFDSGASHSFISPAFASKFMQKHILLMVRVIVLGLPVVLSQPS